MYRSATLAIVVSSTSMKVGTTTAAATNHGLIRRMRRSPRPLGTATLAHARAPQSGSETDTTGPV